MTPTYGNTLMGLAASSPSVTADRGLQDQLLRATAARRAYEVVDPEDTRHPFVDYGATGRVKS